jgi:hypothetical protein
MCPLYALAGKHPRYTSQHLLLTAFNGLLFTHQLGGI